MTTDDKHSPSASPDGLEFRPKPKGIVTVNRKAVAIAMSIVVVVMLGIMFGVMTRKPAGGAVAAQQPTDGSPPTNNRLEPASAMSETITRDIPAGNLADPKRPKDAASSLVPTGTLDAASAAEKQVPELEDARTPPMVAKGSGATPAPGSQKTGPAGVQLASAQAGQGNAGQANAQQGRPNIDPEVERARRLREEREARLRQAMEAPTATNSGGNGAGAQFGAAPGTPQPNQATAAALQQLQALAGGGAAGRQAPGMPATLQPPQREEDDANKQQRKEQFLRDMEAVPDRNFVNSTRKAALSRFEIKAGWLIPAAMKHGINSDLPGKISGQVTQNVYDSATGRHLLIPQGATLVGQYDSQVAYGQNGLLVVWRRIIYPDGSSVDLEGMGGSDQEGYAGFRDEVDNHYMRLIGFGLLTSTFSAAFQISQNERQNSNGTQSPSQVAGQAVAQQMSQLGIEVARKNLRIQPTITTRPGYPFNVRVEKDLVFTRPYVYGNAQ